jgi:hypothetical protein
MRDGAVAAAVVAVGVAGVDYGSRCPELCQNYMRYVFEAVNECTERITLRFRLIAGAPAEFLR